MFLDTVEKLQVDKYTMPIMRDMRLYAYIRFYASVS